mgnify:CR=1 FL=1|jgi:hypothetical protein
MKSLNVTRLESYPAELPTGWAIGFVCECDNGRSFYVDTVVNFDAADDEDAAVDVALESLKEGVMSRCAAEDAKSPLLGTDISDRLVDSDSE